MIRKKKGFTLIELLAVIVILAIIALVLVPIINNVVDASRKAAFTESVSGVIDSTNSYINDYILSHNDELNDYPVVFSCDGTSCKNSDNETLNFKGSVPKSGNIIIYEDGVLAEYITDGKYCAYGYKWNMEVGSNCSEVDNDKPTITGTQNGKTVTLAMVDNESGIDSYCATEDLENCSWIKPTNLNNEEYEIPSAGKWYFIVRDNKGNISDSINFTTTSNDYCSYTSNQVVGEYSYTGGMQSFTVPSGCAGTYKLEVWGSQGGSGGGYGGYSYGNASLSGDDIIHIGVGGTNGYNGGGGGSGGTGGTGGGATHIGLVNAVIKNTPLDQLYLVAGGGGGGHSGQSGGSGGGASGGTGNSNCSSGGGGYGASQTRGGSGRSAQVDSDWTEVSSGSGSYGQGGSGCRSGYAQGGGGGGGGLYGGGGGCGQGGWGAAGGGGGSGYIGGVTNGGMTNGQRSGNGYAKITFISLSD